MPQLIKPYCSDDLRSCLVRADDLDAKIKEATTLRSLQTSPREEADIMMFGQGAYTPLQGFMDHEDWKSVCENMHTASGLFWPIPITFSVDENTANDLKKHERVTLLNQQGKAFAMMTVEDKYTIDKTHECIEVFKTNDAAHPGVQLVNAQKAVNIAGPLEVLSLNGFPERFAGIYMTPSETRTLFTARGWSTVCAFQSRNPMHRAHEYIAKVAIEICDGLLVHSILGPVKSDDIPAEVRVKAIRVLLQRYFRQDTALQGGYPLCMRYAGPREALLHAIVHQNYGCSHIIIGRDHAGVHHYYGPFDAQQIFNEVPKKALQIQPLKLTWTFWCRSCDGMVSQKTCPHDETQWDLISGTALRNALKNNADIPKHFSRPEILDILKDYYQNCASSNPRSSDQPC